MTTPKTPYRMASDLVTRERRWIVVGQSGKTHHISTVELAGLATTYKGPQDRD